MKKIVFINVAKAILSTISLVLISDISVSNIIVPLSAFVLYFFYKNINVVKNKIIVICSIALSFFIAFGKTLPFADQYDYGFMFWVDMFLLFVGFFLFFISFISKIDEIIKKKQNSEVKCSQKNIFIISFIFILACWIPYIIAEYPSPFLPDTIAQFAQVLGDAPFNNANPFIHTVYINILYKAVSLFVHTANDRLFVMSIVQAIINASIYAFIISFFYKRTGKISFVILATLFFSLIYYNAIYNITISKDTSFAIVIMVLIVFYVKYIEDNNNLNMFLLILLLTIFGISRINAYYALIFATLIMLIKFLINKDNKSILIILLVSLVLTTIIKGPIYNRIFESINKEDATTVQEISNDSVVEEDGIDTNVYNGNLFVGKALAALPTIIQTQQIANVVYHNRELNEKETWLIEEAAPLETIKESYNPILVDPMYKTIAENCKDTYKKIDVLEYYKLWLGLFLKYPSDYIEAYLNMTRYYFYPNRVVKTAYTDSWNNNYDVSKTAIVSNEFTRAIENIESIQTKTPIISSFFSPAISIFALLIMMTCILLNKQYNYLVIYLLLLGVFLTLMVSVPINDEFRYIYPIVNSLPIFCILPFVRITKKEKQI